MNKAAVFIRQLLRESVQASWTLFRVMIPTILVLKCIEEAGGIAYLSAALNPVMSVVGLPAELGIVWTTALLVNIYSGLIILVNLDLNLSVAQMSVLGSMILLAHSIPVEGAIARQAGVSLWSTIVVRVGGGLLFGYLLHQFYSATGLLQQTAEMLWQQSSHSTSLTEWALGQINNLATIYVVITVLMLVLKILKSIGIESLIATLLNPFLKYLGISKEATNLTIVGMTLGLSYGGGLLINEAKNGLIKPRDIFCFIMLLNLAHSMIEDTLLILLTGADFVTIFWGRLVFSIGLVAIISFVLRLPGAKKCEPYLYRSVSH